MEGEELSRKEEGGPRRSIYFSGAVVTFPGMLNTSFKGLGEDFEEDEDSFVEVEESEYTEVFPAPMEASEDNGVPTLAQSSEAPSNQSYPSPLDIIHNVTQIMSNIQEA
ncbi:hypothetical protein O181_004116 [Austropuccinia psidii MF-1]|uniref:Uncharacterized protein n=1 Tax=Austropuccinia psidii MF-1 TaxID=1389203 RepID=A0A9Q3BEY1_9BASI|nr:hypothetical protein [Austropuccinia psidii MF-1]